VLINSLKSRRDEEEGFTLIELMVVVLIIAILIAIAIPTFLGARERAQNRAAQSDLRNALTAEKTYYTDEEEYIAAVDSTDDADTTLELAEIEPSLNWDDTTEGDFITVAVGSVTAGDNAVVCVERDSASGATFALADIAIGTSAGTYYNEGACSTTVATVSGWSQDGW
jgi:type IV pilus assembly protein PilA